MLSKYDEIRARRARGEAGFSLIELLVVVVIMGILIAIAVPVYLNYQNNAKKKSAEADVRNAIPAVEQCISNNGNTIGDMTGGSAEGKSFDMACGDGGDVTINVSSGNEVTVAFTGESYTITAVRTDPDYEVEYSSETGAVTKS